MELFFIAKPILIGKDDHGDGDEEWIPISNSVLACLIGNRSRKVNFIFISSYRNLGIISCPRSKESTEINIRPCQDHFRKGWWANTLFQLTVNCWCIWYIRTFQMKTSKLSRRKWIQVQDRSINLSWIQIWSRYHNEFNKDLEDKLWTSWICLVV